MREHREKSSGSFGADDGHFVVLHHRFWIIRCLLVRQAKHMGFTNIYFRRSTHQGRQHDWPPVSLRGGDTPCRLERSLGWGSAMWCVFSCFYLCVSGRVSSWSACRFDTSRTAAGDSINYLWLTGHLVRVPRTTFGGDHQRVCWATHLYCGAWGDVSFHRDHEEKLSVVFVFLGRSAAVFADIVLLVFRLDGTGRTRNGYNHLRR